MTLEEVLRRVSLMALILTTITHRQMMSSVIGCLTEVCTIMTIMDVDPSCH